MYCNNLRSWQIFPDFLEYKSSAGGISGHLNSESKIYNSYNMGDVNSINNIGWARSGGVAGYVMIDSEIKNCYNTGRITASSDGMPLANGIVGYEDESATIDDSYYLSGTASKGQYGSGGTTVMSSSNMSSSSFVNTLNNNQ